MSTLGERIKMARESKNLQQKDLAILVNVKSAGVISNWERDLNKPDAEKIVKLCQVLDISASYLLDYYGEKKFECTLSEQKIIEKFRNLDDFGVISVKSILEIEHKRCKFEAEKISNEMLPTLTKILYGSSPSAGTGNYLPDSIDESTIVIPDTPRNRKADYILQVQGESMEPEYKDGEKVLVQKQDQVELNEIGIFIIDGEAFIKQLKEDRLHSLNPNYEDILFDENQNFHCMGKVIGKL